MLTGGCFCGAVRYEADGPLYGDAICHCVACQRTSGAPMVGFFSTRRDGFRISGPLTEFRSSGHAVRRFCSVCGTQLVFDDSRYPHEIDVTAVSLDDAAALKPRFHIWTRSQQPWVKLADGLPAYPERSPQASGE